MSNLLKIRTIHRTFDLRRVFSSVSETLTNQDKQSSNLSLAPIEEIRKNDSVKNPNPSFASLFKKSKFVGMGNLNNKYLIGKIVEVVGDDLHIDFGGKFNCVCKRPDKNGSFYQRNSNVIIKLIDFEMASYFLSAAKHLTLLEANALLINSMMPFDDPNEKDERILMLKQDIDELNSELYL